MKKTLPILLFMATSVAAIAQDTSQVTKKESYFYFNGALGYALPHTGNISSTQDEPIGTSYKVKGASATSGINGVLGGGYMLDKHVGFELNGLFIAPGKKYDYQSTGYSGGGIQIERHQQFTCMLTPALVFQSSLGQINIYSRLGLVIPVAKKAYYLQTENAPAYTEYRYEEKTQFTLGSEVAVGAKYHFAKHWSIWGELNVLSLAPYIKEYGLTSKKVSGVAQPFQTTPALFAFAGTVRPGGSDINMTNTVPYSSLGVRIGVQYALAHGERENRDDKSAGKKHFYWKVGAGYAVPSGNNMSNLYKYDASITYTYLPTSSGYAFAARHFNEKPVSFLDGLSGSIGAGMMFNKHIGVELDVDAGLLSRKKVYQFSNNDPTFAASGERYYTLTSHAKTPILASPCLVLQTGWKVVNLYSRIGVALPLYNKLIGEITSVDFQGQGRDQTNTYTMAFSLGFTGGAGVRYSVSQRTSLWCEVAVLSYEPYVKKLNVTHVVVNGLAGPDSSVTFEHSTGNTSTFPAYTVPYSNAGLKAGLRFDL